MDFDLKNLEKQFHSDGYKLAMEAVHAGLSPEALFSSLHGLYSTVDEMIRFFLDFAGTKNQKTDCRKGCSWCCHQPVFALSYELAFLNDYMEKNFDESALAKIKERAVRKKAKLNGLPEQEVLRSKIPCPLLENGICLAYSARPVACRIYLSTSLDSCLRFYYEPGNENSVPALPLVPRRLGSMLNEGFKAALKIHGWQAEEMRIDEGI